MKKLRILHVAYFDDTYGSAQCLYEIIERELKSGIIEPVVLNPIHNKMNEFCDKRKVENYSIYYEPFMYPFHDSRPLADLKYVGKKLIYFSSKEKAIKLIEKRIDMNHIDIIHTNNCLLDIGLRLSKLYNIPHIWHLRENGLKHFNYHPLVNKYADYMNSALTTFVAVSNSVKNEWIKLGLDEKKFEVIYDGVLIPEELKSLSQNKDCFRIVMTGGIAKEKGQEIVIHAISELADNVKSKISLDIWGTGNKHYIDGLSKFIQDNKINVNFRGFTDNIWNILPDYDLAINCSVMEAFGRSTIEFLACGLPVIASNCGSNPELITKKKYGLLFDRNNISDIKNKIMEIMENKEFYKLTMRERSEYARRNFSSKTSSDKFIDLVLREKRS